MRPSTEKVNEHLLKVIVVGDKWVGKTAFLQRLDDNTFRKKCKSTIGVNLSALTLRLDDDPVVKLQLWDIAGEERFGSMKDIYFKNATVAIVMVDPTSSNSLKIAKKWIRDINNKVRLQNGYYIPILLVETKTDLTEFTHLTDENRTRLKKEYSNKFNFASITSKHDDKKTLESMLKKSLFPNLIKICTNPFGENEYFEVSVEHAQIISPQPKKPPQPIELPEIKIKSTIVGENGAGKTTLLQKLLNVQHIEKHGSLYLKGRKNIKLYISDTLEDSGNFEGTQLFFVVIDPTKKNAFYNALVRIKKIIQFFENTKSIPLIYLIETKADLENHPNYPSDAEKFIKLNEIEFHKHSAIVSAVEESSEELYNKIFNELFLHTLFSTPKIYVERREALEHVLKNCLQQLSRGIKYTTRIFGKTLEEQRFALQYVLHILGPNIYEKPKFLKDVTYRSDITDAFFQGTLNEVFEPFQDLIESLLRSQEDLEVKRGCLMM